MLADYHTHHERCGHAAGKMADYVEAAIEAGLAEIGLSDHAPLFHVPGDPHPVPQGAMHQDQWIPYLREMMWLRERYAGRIQVRLGVESDFIVGWSGFYRRLWSRWPLDYVIGSVHWLGDWNIFSPKLPEGRSAEEMVEAYLLATQEAARSGAFQIIGHLDCIKTSGHLPSTEVTPLVEETIEVLAECDVAIELNTSGWRKPCADAYPNREWLACAADKGVPVTLGSDAHRPGLVGADFDRALALLRECGYTHLAFFEQKRRRLLPI